MKVPLYFKIANRETVRSQPPLLWAVTQLHCAYGVGRRVCICSRGPLASGAPTGAVKLLEMPEVL